MYEIRQKLKLFSECKCKHFAVHKTTSCSSDQVTPPIKRQALCSGASLLIGGVAKLILELSALCTVSSVVDNEPQIFRSDYIFSFTKNKSLSLGSNQEIIVSYDICYR